MFSLRAAIPRGERAPQFAELVTEARRKFERGVAHSLAPFLRVCPEVVWTHGAIRTTIFQTLFSRKVGKATLDERGNFCVGISAEFELVA